MDGLEATRNIRLGETNGKYIGRRVPIVAVSANARQVYAERAEDAGMDGFLRKPYSKVISYRLFYVKDQADPLLSLGSIIRNCTDIHREGIERMHLLPQTHQE